MINLGWLWTALNANLPIAFVGGLTGAIGGALGAQYIAERMKRREERVREIRSTNAAIMTCFSICNTALIIKHQHVEPMRSEFEKQKADLEMFKVRQAEGKSLPDQVHQVTADFRQFSAPIVPIDTLKTLVFERISVYGRPLALVSVLEQSLTGLTQAIGHRGHLIQRFQSGAIPKERFAHHYFGLRQASGETDQEYSDTVSVIASYTDDVAFFSALLCQDLVKHGEEVRALVAKLTDKSVPRVSKADFSGPKAKGLLPSDKNYADWLSGFQEGEGKAD
jgi:hypothetical protein